MREFVITSGGATVSGTTTLVAVRASGAPTVNIEFLRWWVGQAASATSAQQRIHLTLNSGTVTGSAHTPAKTKEGDPNASVIVGTTTLGAGTCITVGTANESAIVKTVVHEDAFNVLNGWLY